jgi:hypothetical protein
MKLPAKDSEVPTYAQQNAARSVGSLELFALTLIKMDYALGHDTRDFISRDWWP